MKDHVTVQMMGKIIAAFIAITIIMSFLVDDDTDETDTFVAQQQAFNDKIAKQLADISAKLNK